MKKILLFVALFLSFSSFAQQVSADVASEPDILKIYNSIEGTYEIDVAEDDVLCKVKFDSKNVSFCTASNSVEKLTFMSFGDTIAFLHYLKGGAIFIIYTTMEPQITKIVVIAEDGAIAFEYIVEFFSL